MDRNGFGELVNRLCKDYGLSNKKFAQRCEIDEPTATRIRKGEVKPAAKIQLILERLPEDETVRSQLQIELMLDYLATFSDISPLIEIGVKQGNANSLDQQLKQADVPIRLRKAFNVLIQATVTAPHLAKSIQALAQQLTAWNVLQKYPPQNADIQLVAAPKNKRYAKKSKKK